LQRQIDFTPIDLLRRGPHCRKHIDRCRIERRANLQPLEVVGLSDRTLIVCRLADAVAVPGKEYEILCLKCLSQTLSDWTVQCGPGFRQVGEKKREAYRCNFRRHRKQRTLAEAAEIERTGA
jgi:hypothetical protein